MVCGVDRLAEDADSSGRLLTSFFFKNICKGFVEVAQKTDDYCIKLTHKDEI